MAAGVPARRAAVPAPLGGRAPSVPPAAGWWRPQPLAARRLRPVNISVILRRPYTAGAGGPAPKPADLRSLRERFYVLPKLTTVIGRFRPWTLDHFVAMFSWLLVGNVLFLVVGTTTFASLVVWVANTLQFQGAAKLISWAGSGAARRLISVWPVVPRVGCRRRQSTWPTA